MKLFVLSVILFTTASCVSGRRWATEDAIVVDAGEDEESFRVKRDVDDKVVLRGQACYSMRGFDGRCMTFKECFPGLVPYGNDKVSDTPEGVGVYNQNLGVMLVSQSGFCGGSSNDGVYSTEDEIARIFSDQVLRSDVEICCENPRYVPSNVTLGPEVNHALDKPRGSCGTIKINTNELEKSYNDSVKRIVGGRDAVRGEFPWMVSLMSGPRQFCGGSLIDEDTVLTAAHCVQMMTTTDVAKFAVHVGDFELGTTSDGQHEVRTAARIMYHKNFNMKRLNDDIGMIKLNKPVTFTEYIQPVCLHSGEPKYDDGTIHADVIGWGMLYDDGPQSKRQKSVNLRVWTHEECFKKYQGHVAILNGMVCAGSPGKDSCRGDSGGPLVIGSRSDAKQIGVVSFGIGCGEYAGVYTRVNRYISWIQKNIKTRQQ